MANLQKAIIVPDYPVDGAEHEYTWSEEDCRKLRVLFGRTNDLVMICNELQRPMGAIVPKIVQLGLADSYYEFDYEFDTGNTILRRRISTGIYVHRPPTLSDREDNILELNHLSTNCRCTTTPILGEEEMEAKLIETVTFIHGVRADQKTDMEIFQLIKQLEKTVEELKLIKNRPNKLNQHIASIEADIKALVDYVDGRGEIKEDAK